MDKNHTNVELLKTLGLPVITSLKDLSYKLLLSERLLFNLSMFPQYYYKAFTIPKKKKGEFRYIHSPKSSLRVLQSWILVNILERIPLSDIAMGFRKGEQFGIIPNARYHKDSTYILKIDLENFFPSIRRRKVYPIFKELGYSQFIANVFTNYCMLDGSIPQGASTSPYISNVVFKGTDEKIFDLCNNDEIVYTRYADDLIFSSNNRSSLLDLLYKVNIVIEDDGFKINEEKTKLMVPACRKIVTGFVVNSGEVRVKKELRRNARSMIFNDIFKGKGYLSRKTKGYLSFIKQAEPDTFKSLQEYVAKIILKSNLAAVTKCDG